MEESKKKCWMCSNEIDEEDKFCRYCGKGQNENAKLPYTLLGVLALLLVIGPLCLVNLWKSPLIKKEDKNIYTILIGAITLLIVFAIIYGLYFIMSYYIKVFNITGN